MRQPQMRRFVAAANCSEMHPAETSLYAHLYAHLPSLLTTDQVQASSYSPRRPIRGLALAASNGGSAARLSGGVARVRLPAKGKT
jgi:hypothetical protein